MTEITDGVYLLQRPICINLPLHDAKLVVNFVRYFCGNAEHMWLDVAEVSGL